MSTNLLKSQKRMRRVRKINGIVAVAAGTPSITAGSDFTISDDGAGLVTVTLLRPGRVLLGAHAMAIEPTTTIGQIVKAITATATAVQFGVFVIDGTDGVLVDNVGFAFEITVKDVAN